MGAPPRVGVREVPGGFFSAYLVHEVRPGDVIEVLPPSGTFTADLTVPGDHVFVVAGSGITPALSLAATVLRDGTSTVTVFYGNRRPNTGMFADELADLKDRYGPRLQLVHVLSREPRDAELTSGRLDGARLRTLVDNLVDAGRGDPWWLGGAHGMGGPLVAVRPARQGRRPPRAAGRARRPRRAGAPGAVLRRRRPAGAGARSLGYRRGPQQPGHRRARRALDHPGSPPRRAGAGLGAEGPRRRALRLQGRGVRHLPGPGHRRRGPDAPELRPGGSGGRGRVRAHLPDRAGVRRRHRRLRRLTRVRPIPAGATAELDVVVTAEMTVRFDELGPVHPVYATYSMAKHFEAAGRKLLLRHLEPGEAAIGRSVSVEHLSSAWIGDTVRVTAECVELSGNRLTCA